MEDHNSSSNSSCFTDEQNRTILLTYTCIGAITVIVCLIGITLVICKKLHKSFVYRLAMYQVMAALFFGLTRSLQLINLDNMNDKPSVSCKTVAFLVVCSSWVKLILTVWVNFHLFAYTVFLKNLKILEPMYVLSSLFIGPLIAAIPLITQSYGQAGPWCWIESHHRTTCTDENMESDDKEKLGKGGIQQIALWYGPAFVVLLINSVLVAIIVVVSIFRIHFKIWSNPHGKAQWQSQMLIQRHSSNSNRQKQALYLLLPLLAYPIIFCVLITIPLTNRVYEIKATSPNYKLFMASAVAIPTSGLAAGIVLITHILFVIKCGLNNNNCCMHKKQTDVTDEASKKPCQSDYSTVLITQHVVAKESDVDEKQL